MFPYLCLILAAATSAPAGSGAPEKKLERPRSPLIMIQTVEVVPPGSHVEVTRAEVAPRDLEPAAPIVLPSEFPPPIKAKPLDFSAQVEKEMGRLRTLIGSTSLTQDDRFIELKAQATKARLSLLEMRPLLVRFGKIENVDFTENYRSAMARVEAVRRIVEKHEQPIPDAKAIHPRVKLSVDSFRASGLKLSPLRLGGAGISVKELDDACKVADALVEHLGNALQLSDALRK
jgi:hypothetical protein